MRLDMLPGAGAHNIGITPRSAYRHLLPQSASARRKAALRAMVRQLVRDELGALATEVEGHR